MTIYNDKALSSVPKENRNSALNYSTLVYFFKRPSKESAVEQNGTDTAAKWCFLLLSFYGFQSLWGFCWGKDSSLRQQWELASSPAVPEPRCTLGNPPAWGWVAPACPEWFSTSCPESLESPAHPNVSILQAHRTGLQSWARYWPQLCALCSEPGTVLCAQVLCGLGIHPQIHLQSAWRGICSSESPLTKPHSALQVLHQGLCFLWSVSSEWRNPKCEGLDSFPLWLPAVIKVRRILFISAPLWLHRLSLNFLPFLPKALRSPPLNSTHSWHYYGATYATKKKESHTQIAWKR